jgi:hypothetical protein
VVHEIFAAELLQFFTGNNRAFDRENADTNELPQHIM